MPATLTCSSTIKAGVLITPYASLNATTEYISSNLDKLKIIDVREADEYNGAVKYGEARGGHLPKAINITWTKLYNTDGTVKSQK